MNIFKKLTKRLFGQNDPKDDAPPIIDGEIIYTPENINIKTYKCLNSQTHKSDLVSDIIPAVDGDHVSIENTGINQTEANKAETQPSINYSSNVPEQYFIFLGSAGRAERTIQEYTWELGWWEQQSKPLAELSLPQIESIINAMHPATARRKIAALRSYARWQLRNGDDRLFVTLSQIIPPRIPIRVPKDKGKDAFKELSRRAIDMTRAGDRRGIWLGLMLCCGLRISEIQTTRAAPDGAIKVLGKGNKERLVPAPEWLRSAIRQNQKNGEHWAKDRKLIWAEMKKMNIRKPHSLRHTYASELVRNGLELEQVKSLLGHAKLDTTLIYARTKLPENLIEKLGIAS
jgi:integrase/recombinase XerD